MKVAPKSTPDSSKKRIAVIKNSHTRAEMRAVEREFVNHKGPFLTLQQALDLAKARQQQQSHEKAV